MENTQKTPKFSCDPCDFVTNNKKDLNRHFLTAKHFKRTKPEQKEHIISGINKLCCKMCKKQYKSRSGLWSHLKICEITEKKDTKVDITNKELMIQLIKENSEFKSIILEIIKNQQPQQVTSINGNSNNINSHNKQFNLQFFLNETCKNAMNMTEFMDSIVIKSNELEDMGKLGYVKGISNIFIRALNELDEKERPLHCTDIKRETIYIKDNNIWEKETIDKLKVKKIINFIANKNFRQIPQWKKENPQSEDIMTKKHMEYMNMISQIMSGISPEDENDVNKIIKNVSYEVYLDKKAIMVETLPQASTY